MRHTAREFLLLLIPAALARSQAPTRAVTIGVADSIWSPTLKENRRFLVYTPPSYTDTTYLPRRYPVLYLLDGDAHFHSVTGLVQILGTGVNGTFVVPEMIVVAIPNTNRARDMTPTRVERDLQGRRQPALATSGGMANFLTFIESELFPRIEQTYRTAPYRVLVGHSLGGITAINALYTRPSAFNGYFNAIVQFNSILETFNASGLRYAYKYFPNDSHGSVPMISEYDALRFKRQRACRVRRLLAREEGLGEGARPFRESRRAAARGSASEGDGRQIERGVEIALMPRHRARADGVTSHAHALPHPPAFLPFAADSDGV